MFDSAHSSSDSASPPSEDPVDLYLDDEDRYSRLRLISWWQQERLQAARVLVVGAGALGNEVLKNLAMLGCGTILVIDLDDVEASNLSRSILFRANDGGRPKAQVAAEAIVGINPDVRVIPIVGDALIDLGLGLIAAVDVVIGCLDNREARLWINRMCWKVGTPWIDGAIQEIQGVVKVFVPPDSSCYECGMTAQDYQLLNLRYSCPLLSREDLLQGKVPTAPTIASMIGAQQVQEALKLIHGMEVAAGSIHVFNGISNQTYTTHVPIRPDCMSHESYPEVYPVKLSHRSTLGELFAAVARLGLDGPHRLVLDRELVTRIEWPKSGRSREVMRPRSAVSTSLLTGGDDDGEGRPLLISEVTAEGGWEGRSLVELGIPSWEIVRVESEEANGFFRLDGDRPDWDWSARIDQSEPERSPSSERLL